jgi:hypothetical protein
VAVRLALCRVRCVPRLYEASQSVATVLWSAIRNAARCTSGASGCAGSQILNSSRGECVRPMGSTDAQIPEDKMMR